MREVSVDATSAATPSAGIYLLPDAVQSSGALASWTVCAVPYNVTESFNASVNVSLVVGIYRQQLNGDYLAISNSFTVIQREVNSLDESQCNIITEPVTDGFEVQGGDRLGVLRRSTCDRAFGCPLVAVFSQDGAATSPGIYFHPIATPDLLTITEAEIEDENNYVDVLVNIQATVGECAILMHTITIDYIHV